ncbi:MAG TPA: hypothetical protein VGF99_12955 [Myxococcota bacterium]
MTKRNGDQNLYPDEPPGVRRRRRRAKRPAHLPPFDPDHGARADVPVTDRVEVSRPTVVAPAPPPSFGASTNPALRFHQLRGDRHAPTRRARTDHDTVADTTGGPSDDVAGRRSADG